MSTFIKKSYHFLVDLYKSRNLLVNLSLNDFKTRYAGSYFGVLWGFVQPVCTILIYWFVFQVGFRTGSRSDGIPFIIWLVAGLTPWFFFSEAIISSSNCLIEYSYLVKKVVFRISILPIVKILSCMYIHFFFLFICIFILGFYKFISLVYLVQLIYYIICMLVLLLGISWFTSSITVFFRDMSQLMNLIVQIIFWLIPIVWAEEVIPKDFLIYFKLNPVYYIIQGYRDTFIYKVWFWEKPIESIFFWIVTLIIFFFGLSVFQRLKKHFADVL